MRRSLRLGIAWVFAGLGICVGLPAQTPAYLRYGVSDGLPSNLVYYGVQDSDGLLWFGTDKGLARFDGTRFRLYDMADGLPDLEVLNLKTDRLGRMWVFCFRNKVCYRQNGRFFSGKTDSLLHQLNFATGLADLLEDGDGSLWFAGFSRYGYRVQGERVGPLEYSSTISKIIRLPDAVIGLTGSSIHVDYIRLGTDSYANGVVRRVAAPEVLADVRINDALADTTDGRLMISTDKGLYLFQWRAGNFQLLDHRPMPVGRVFLDKSGCFWLCTLSAGAFCFEAKTRSLDRQALFLPGKKVTMVFEDHQQTLWFCTAGEGVFALPFNAPLTYGLPAGSPTSNIMAVARDAAGVLLAGDSEGNLHRVLPGGMIPAASLGSLDGYNRVRQILPRPDGSHWIVTDEGLYQETGLRTSNRPAIRLIEPVVLGHAKEIYVDSSYVWVTTSARLFQLTADGSDTLFSIISRKTTLDKDSDGYLWVGGIEDFYGESDHFTTNWSERFPLLKSRIVVIRNGGPGRLWVVTPEAGLLEVRVKAGAVETVEEVSGRLSMPIANIQTLFTQPGGRLWMATNRGVYGMDANWRVIHFDSHDGLADDDVNAVAVYGDTLWAATAKGLTRLVLPSGQSSGSFATRITGVRYRHGDQLAASDLLDSFPARSTVLLPAGASLVQLDLTGLFYRGRGNLRYRCVIVNELLPLKSWTLDNLAGWMWNGFQGRTDSTFVDEPLLSFGVNLPPGRYRVQVTAINAGGQASDHPAEIFLLMTPQFYETLWFWLLLWGVATYALWRIYRARTAYKDLNTAVSALRLQALRAQINPHFVGNSINAIQQFFYPPNPVRASEYIATFTGLLRRTLLFSEKNFIYFREEIAYDRDYLKLIRLRFGERFRFEITGTEQVPASTLFPAMLLQTLLENATLHGLAPEGVSELHLDFKWQGQELVSTVTDNGIGYEASLRRKRISPPERKSKGLEILVKKIETLNHLYDVQLRFSIEDLGQPPHAAGRRGTRAVIAFTPPRKHLLPDTDAVGALYPNLHKRP